MVINNQLHPQTTVGIVTSEQIRDARTEVVGKVAVVRLLAEKLLAVAIPKVANRDVAGKVKVVHQSLTQSCKVMAQWSHSQGLMPWPMLPKVM